MTKDEIETELIKRFFEDRLDRWKVCEHNDDSLHHTNTSVDFIPEDAKSVEEVEQFIITEEVSGSRSWRMVRAQQ